MLPTTVIFMVLAWTLVKNLEAPPRKVTLLGALLSVLTIQEWNDEINK